MASDSMTIQSVILSKDVFDSLDKANTWAQQHDFKLTFEGKPPDETSTSYRYRQRDPNDFKPNSFRTIKLRDGVAAVVGQLKDPISKDLSADQLLHWWFDQSFS